MDLALQWQLEQHYHLSKQAERPPLQARPSVATHYFIHSRSFTASIYPLSSGAGSGFRRFAGGWPRSASSAALSLFSSPFGLVLPPYAPMQRAAVRMSATATDLETEIKADLAALISEKGCGPIMIRLSWHDAGVFSDGEASAARS